MKRKIYNQLVEWKQKRQGREALLIDGARRVGKSYIVTQFAQNEYKSHIILDFNGIQPEIVELFDHYVHDLDMFFSHLQLYTGVRLYPRQSLIVFDEVQLCPKARAAIKYLVEDGRYDYIETGSLVSINRNVKDIVIPSEEHRINMYPMDLEEFLWAMGDNMIMDYVRECYVERKPLGAVLHRKMMEYMRLYMIIGGMPQAVKAYALRKNFEDVYHVQQDIIALYRNDILKYGGQQAEHVTRVFDAIPSQLQRHEKKFHLSSLQHGARMRNYENAFFWLDESRVANTCFTAYAPDVGLNLLRGDKFKLYLADTGLLIALAFKGQTGAMEIYQKLLKGKLELNQGMLMENMVAQMLTAAGHPLFFYGKSSIDASERMEIDFLLLKSPITDRHNIIPVEVKSSQRFTTTSLDKCCKRFAEQVTTPLVLYTGDVCVRDSVCYLPLYMTMLL